jgi:endonuclease-3
MKFLSESEIREVFERFKAANPEPTTELVAPNPYTLLVAVVLSAQMTDKGVNRATGPLFAIADTPAKMIALGEDVLLGYIKSVGLYLTKARHIIGLSRILVEEYAGGLPRTREGLESLPGVGRKTANVILNVVYGEKTMPVDTHLLRIAPRMGLSAGKTPGAVEKDLLARIPVEYLDHAHHWLVLHGRYVCTARKPACETCLITNLCPKNIHDIISP